MPPTVNCFQLDPQPVSASPARPSKHWQQRSLPGLGSQEGQLQKRTQQTAAPWTVNFCRAITLRRARHFAAITLSLAWKNVTTIWILFATLAPVNVTSTGVFTLTQIRNAVVCFKTLNEITLHQSVDIAFCPLFLFIETQRK